MAENQDWRPLLVSVYSRVPSYLKLGWALARSPEIPTRKKGRLLGGVLYSVSPVDLVPGFIPVLGQLDDLGMLLLSIKSTLQHCSPELKERLLEESHLSEQQLEDDLGSLGVIARGVGKTVAKGAWKGTVWLGDKVGKGFATGTDVLTEYARSWKKKR